MAQALKWITALVVSAVAALLLHRFRIHAFMAFLGLALVWLVFFTLRKRKAKVSRGGESLSQELRNSVTTLQGRIVQAERYIAELERIGEAPNNEEDQALKEENNAHVNKWLSEQREYLNLLDQAKTILEKLQDNLEEKKNLFRMAQENSPGSHQDARPGNLSGLRSEIEILEKKAFSWVRFIEKLPTGSGAISALKKELEKP